MSRKSPVSLFRKCSRSPWAVSAVTLFAVYGGGWAWNLLADPELGAAQITPSIVHVASPVTSPVAPVAPAASAVTPVASVATPTPSTPAVNTSPVSDKLWTEKRQSENEKDRSASINIAALNKAFVDLAKGMSPAVVNIYTTTRTGAPRGRFGGQGPGQGQMSPDDLFQYFFGNPFGGGMPGQGGRGAPSEAQALGSGFVVNKDGVVVTNSHVVRMNGRNADEIMVKFMSDPSASKGHVASVLGVDETTDVAVLKLKTPPKNIVFAPLGDSDKAQVGEWVVAIGNPYGHTNSVTKGIVSALGRSIAELDNRTNFIQTDASINPGNSGGPLFNLYGEVIGINTAIDARAQGIGFAIPVNVAKSVVRQIIEKGEVSIGFVGVSLGDLNPRVAKSLALPKTVEGGALILDPIAGQPAAKAGLKSYDVVIEIDGKPVGSSREFTMAVRNKDVGQKANLKFYRDGALMQTVLTVGKRPSAKELARIEQQPVAPAGKPVGKTGLVLSDITPPLRERLGLDPTVRGAVVVGLDPNGLGARAGFEPGDVILEIDRKVVKSRAEAEAALKKNPSGFMCKMLRGSATIIMSVDD